MFYAQKREIDMGYIVESINKKGIVTSEFGSRIKRVKSGDVIDFEQVEGNYPHMSGRYGRVWFIDGQKVMYCCEPGSAFLRDDGSVDISGGPFGCCSINQLEPLYKTHVQVFWNWGNNLPGADQGVYYHIERPIFRLLPE